MSTSSRSRVMWRALEPYLAVVYFAPEPRAATDALGARGGWMSYFALRAAPLGPAPAELVAATFYGFHLDLVGRAIPDAWAAASPQRYLDARLESVDAALRRVLGDAVDGRDLAEAAELAATAAACAPTAGRPLAAANAALRWPDAPHLRLWHAQNLLRESRGDGHIAALVTAGIDPCESLLLVAADGLADAERLRGARGWPTQDWADATARLTERGLLDDGGGLTDDGVRVRTEVERATDAGIAAPWEALGEQGCRRLAELMTPLVDAVDASGAFLAANPMGLQRLPSGPVPGWSV